MKLNQELKKQLLKYQINEITEHFIYKKISKTVKSEHNRQTLLKISDEEKQHYQEWKKYTGQEQKPDKIKIWFYYWIARLFGFTFSIKLMERGEKGAQHNYGELVGKIDNVDSIMQQEEIHEDELIKMLDEDRLKYAGAVVLGLNDALVELTGTLAGLTFALQNSKLIAMSGLIVGIAAALSMGSSEYLQSRTEKSQKNPLKASLYTTFAYLLTVFILLIPYLIFTSYFFSLLGVLIAAIFIILVFNSYISVVHDESFIKRFLEMAGVSLSVAIISFLFGYGVRIFLGINV